MRNQMYSSQNQGPLSNDQLMRLAPSIFAQAPSESRSERYAFIPTIQVVDILRTQGWVPVKAMQSRGRTEDRKLAAKHMVRFQNGAKALKVGDSIPELVLLNAHDGTSSFQLMGGIYRLVCSNGMIVGENFDVEKIKHIGYKNEQVIEASYRILESVPKIAAQVDAMQAVELSREEQQIFADAALGLKFEPKEGVTAPIRAEQLLLTRRSEDRKQDLWSTFNTVQENMLRGGLRGVSSSTESGRPRRMRTREVTAVSENVRLNRALWTLAESMAALKVG